MENFDEVIQQYTKKQVDEKTGAVSYIFKHTHSKMRYIDIRDPRKIIKKPREKVAKTEPKKPPKVITEPKKRYKKFVKLKINDLYFNSVETAAMHFHVPNRTIYQWIYRGQNGTERIYEE